MPLLSPDEIRALKGEPVTRCEAVLEHAGRLGKAAREILEDRDAAIVELLARGQRQAAVAGHAGLGRAQMLRYRGRANERARALGLDVPFPDVP